MIASFALRYERPALLPPSGRAWNQLACTPINCFAATPPPPTGARAEEAAEAEARHTGRGGSGELILRCSQQSTLRLEAQLPPYSVTQVHVSIKHDKE